MTRHAAWHMWRLSEAGDDNLGLACSDDGLFIGRTPLIEKRDGKFSSVNGMTSSGCSAARIALKSALTGSCPALPAWRAR
jgi:hypothetical protein